MANIGHFDAETRALAWFDTSALSEGWWDYGMPFKHDLIGEAAVAGGRIFKLASRGGGLAGPPIGLAG